MPATTCEKCGKPRKNGERFCTVCRNAMLGKMKASNYLTRQFFRRPPLDPGSQENIYETKYGRD